MNSEIIIRDENSEDICAIADVTVEAFKTLELSSKTERFIIAALRAAKALAVSLVAEKDGRIVGHIAFSPVTLSDGKPGWYGLGPVSVLPTHQREGIGKRLIEEGFLRLKKCKAQGCCLVGHPEYYQKFGFKNEPALICEGVPSNVFFAISFSGYVPNAIVRFHEAFTADGQQVAGGNAHSSRSPASR